MKRTLKQGQSLVELALSLTLIFTLLAAGIDLGLAFFAYQGISGAAQEGANYAALYPVTSNDDVRLRAVNEAGLNVPMPHRARFVNLFDLNGDKTDDTPAIRAGMITVSIVSSDLHISGSSEWNAQTTSCQTRIDPQFCSKQVRVNYTYKTFFPAAGLFGFGDINLAATRNATISR